MRRLLAIALLMAAGCTDQAGLSGPNILSVGFGSGGSNCSLTGDASAFPQGVPVHAVLTMEPVLPTGGTVKVKVEQDGVELVESGQTITATEPAPCVRSTFPDLDVGQYRITYAISQSQMPPASGEFDITPTASTLAPTESTSDTPTPPSDASLATHIIGHLDELAVVAAEDDVLLTANWAIDESEWVTENMSALLDQGGTLERYVDELTTMLNIVAEGGDQAAAIGRLLGLRDEIATEFALPTLAPTPTSEP